MSAAILALMAAPVSAGEESPMVEAPKCEEVLIGRVCVGMTSEQAEAAYQRLDKPKKTNFGRYHMYSDFKWDNPGDTVSEYRNMLSGPSESLIASVSEKYGKPEKADIQEPVFSFRSMGPTSASYAAIRYTWKKGSVVITTTVPVSGADYISLNYKVIAPIEGLKI